MSFENPSILMYNLSMLFRTKRSPIFYWWDAMAVHSDCWPLIPYLYYPWYRLFYRESGFNGQITLYDVIHAHSNSSSFHRSCYCTTSAFLLFFFELTETVLFPVIHGITYSFNMTSNDFTRKAKSIMCPSAF